MRVIIYVGAAVLCIGGAIYISRLVQQSFYVEALAAAHIKTNAQTQEELRLAYAQALARRAPLFDTSGIDPDALLRAIEALKTSTAHTIDNAGTSTGKDLFPSLYPVRFLHAIAETERARRAFLASGENTDEQIYEERQQEAAAAGESDVENLKESFLNIFKGRTYRFSGLGGMISTSLLISNTDTVKARMQEVRAVLGERTLCIQGHITHCNKADILPPMIPETPSFQILPADLKVSEEIETLKHDAISNVHPYRTVILASSSCMGILPGPYFFELESNQTGGRTIPLKYVHELYFQELTAKERSQNPLFAYLAYTYGITYKATNPMMFYVCPELGNDESRARALSLVADFAAAHPSIARTQSALLRGSGPLTEWDALAYLRSARNETVTDGSEHEFETVNDLIRIYRDRSIGLDTIISQIAYTNDVHATRVAQGIPYHISPLYLFLTHSAYPTLFLTDNPSAGRSIISIREPDSYADTRSIFERNFTTYSYLIGTVSRDKILHDIRVLLKFDGVE